MQVGKVEEEAAVLSPEVNKAIVRRFEEEIWTKRSPDIHR
jgi:hypothetical protein